MRNPLYGSAASCAITVVTTQDTCNENDEYDGRMCRQKGNPCCERPRSLRPANLTIECLSAGD